MKKILLPIIAVAMVLFTSCNEKIIGADDKAGEILFGVSADEKYTVVTKAGENVDTDEFDIIIKRLYDNYILPEYSKVKDIPEILTVPAGEYEVAVSSPGHLPAAFNQPVYAGSKNFTVNVGEVTAVTVVAGLQNVKVTVKPTENFLNELSSYTIRVSNGEGSDHALSWKDEEVTDETKAGYFDVTDSGLDIHVDGYRVLGGDYTTYDTKIKPESVKAKNHYILNIDAKTTGSVGGGDKPGFIIDIDYTTNDINEDILIDGIEEVPVPGEPTEPDNPDEPDPIENGPQLIWEENPDFAEVELKREGMNVELLVKAAAGIKNFIVNVDSESELFMGAISAMSSSGQPVLDLIGDEALIEGLGGMIDLPMGNALKDQTEVTFPMSALLPMIIQLDSNIAVGSKHKFILEVTDNEDVSRSWTLTFRYDGN